MITHQAQIIAYIDEFKVLMIWMLVVIPLLIVFSERRAMAVRIKRSSRNDV
jgi:hypothetical protein